jgi:hypothetical protein
MQTPAIKYMKQVLLLLVFALLLFAEFMVQNEPLQINPAKVPAVVSASFTQSYPEISDVRWMKGENYYEARYDSKFRENTALFDQYGNLLATGTRIHSKDLPKGILNFTSANYPGKRIKKSIELIFTGQNKASYEIQISNASILLDSDGTPMTASSRP